MTRRERTIVNVLYAVMIIVLFGTAGAASLAALIEANFQGSWLLAPITVSFAFVVFAFATLWRMSVDLRGKALCGMGFHSETTLATWATPDMDRLYGKVCRRCDSARVTIGCVDPRAPLPLHHPRWKAVKAVYDEARAWLEARTGKKQPESFVWWG